MQGGELTFTAVGEIEFNAYKEWYISWGQPGTGIKVGRLLDYSIERLPDMESKVSGLF